MKFAPVKGDYGTYNTKRLYCTWCGLEFDKEVLINKNPENKQQAS